MTHATTRQISLNRVQKRTDLAVKEAYQDGGNTLIHAPPISGKTTAAIRNANAGPPITYLTQRVDLYQQARDKCKDNGLSFHLLPSPHRYCPTFKGTHGKAVQRRVENYYKAGVSARRLHDLLNLPCAPNCPYMKEWKFEPSNFQVLIGHYLHAYVSEVTADRIVVIDEFPEGAFEMEIQSPNQLISTFLQHSNSLPFQNWSDLLANRDCGGEVVVRWFANHRHKLPASQILSAQGNGLHALASILTLSLFLMDDLGNGFETAHPYTCEHLPNRYETSEIKVPLNEIVPWRRVFPSHHHCVRDRHSNTMWLFTQPDLSEAAGIVGLDGTPVERLWDFVFGERFACRSILSEQEFNAYIWDSLDMEIYQVSEYPKAYSGGSASLETDKALLYGIEATHDSKPALITTKKALSKYKINGLLAYTKAAMNYAQILSSNKFSSERVGVVCGSVHPGDSTIKKWAAYMGEQVERSGKGNSLSYGSLGDEILSLYREKRVLQALLRFGRDGQGATVYLNTNAIPSWLNVHTSFEKTVFSGEKTRLVVDELRCRGQRGVTAKELTKELGISKSTVYRALNKLSDQGYVMQTNGGKYGTIYSWKDNP